MSRVVTLSRGGKLLVAPTVAAAAAAMASGLAVTVGVAWRTVRYLKGVSESSNRAMRAPIWLVEAAKMIGTAPFMKVAAGPAWTASATLLVVFQAEATAAVTAAGLQEPLLRVLMVNLLANGLGEKLRSRLDSAAELTLTP